MEEQMPQSQPKKGNPSLWIVLILVVLIAAAAILYFGDFFNTNTNSNTTVNSTENVNLLGNQNTNESTNTNIFTNIPLTTTTGFHFTDVTTNLFNGYTYSIRKNEGEDFCGTNGSSICDLIEDRNGQKFVIANLFFSDSPKISLAFLQGASIIKFQDKDTLLLNYSAQDHGGGYSSVYSYNITTKDIQELITFARSESSNSGDYSVDYYIISKDSKSIVFVNYPSGKYDSKGVYAELNGSLNPIDISIEGPYNIRFDTNQNYQTSLISLTVNDHNHTYNFSNQEFK